MVRTIESDLITDKQFDIFCHQVNCHGAMGSGIAARIKKAYPEVYDAYRQNYLVNDEHPECQLGTNLLVNTSDGRVCVNMYGQNKYGTGAQFTEYPALAECMLDLIERLATMDAHLKVGFPDHIGCGLAGGNWLTVEGMIEVFADRVAQDVYIVKLKGQQDDEEENTGGSSATR